MADKSKAKEMQKKLAWEYPHIAREAPKQIDKAEKFAAGYKKFISDAKTEREVVKEAVKLLDKAGYTPFDPEKKYTPGDKVYKVNRNKALLITTFGREPLKKGVRINGAHIDSPRIDLKANPVYEKNELALFKTHYYGGIRKYQWATIPLSMHGVMFKKEIGRAHV